MFHRCSREDYELVDKIIKRLKIQEIKDRQISQLSGGQIQKVLIARALATEANCLVLDEPTASLDAEAKGEIYNLLKEINEDTTVISTARYKVLKLPIQYPYKDIFLKSLS